MSRAFTTREKVLIFLLAAIFLAITYYFAIWKPTSESIEEAKQQKDELTLLLDIEQMKALKMAEMKKDLEEAERDAESGIITPEYDNIQNVLTELNTALSNITDYKISPRPLKLSNNLAIREIQLSFTCPSYKVASRIINNLNNGQYNCSISELKVSAADSKSESISNSSVSVSLTMLYYEFT